MIATQVKLIVLPTRPEAQITPSSKAGRKKSVKCINTALAEYQKLAVKTWFKGDNVGNYSDFSPKQFLEFRF